MKKILIAGLSMLSIAATAQTALPIKKVTVFKNATSMVVKEGSANVKDGSVKLPISEQVLYGTYFIGSNKDNSVKNIVFRNDTLKKRTPANAVWQFMAGNTNKPVTISYSPTQGIDRSASGKITDYNLYNSIVTLATDAGRTLVLNSENIYQADFKDTPVPFYMADSIKRMMILKPEKAAENVSLQEIYMTGGINWIPSYYLRLKDDKAARLEMKATVENYAEDLKETETELVVGSPQMSFSGKMDPMTYDYLTVANGGNNDGRVFKTYMQSNALTSTPMGGTATYEWADVASDGEKSGDMYIYKIGKITLPNQSKGTFPIFAGNVDYKDKYEGTIDDISNFFATHDYPRDEKPFDIFHSLEIKNTSSVPLTTASVMVVNDKEQFVAQDELKYTPVGANSTIRLSKAIDIIMKNSEEEKTREDNAKKIAKTSYSKIILKGTVNIENYQAKDVTVTVTKSLNGTVLTNSDNAKSTKKTTYNYINPYSEVKWEVKLNAGEKKALTYEYEVYFIP